MHFCLSFNNKINELTTLEANKQNFEFPVFYTPKND